MVTISKPLALVLASAITIGTASFGAHAESSNTQVFKPARGISLDVGSKKIVAYYLANDRVCDLTVMVADLPDADGNLSGKSSRMNVPVKAGTSSHVYTADGRALEVSCAISTKLMTLRPLEQTAEVK
jgi:hypothetical protein